MWRHKELSNTNSESPKKMLSDDMLRFVFVYDARFADALPRVPEIPGNLILWPLLYPSIFFLKTMLSSGEALISKQKAGCVSDVMTRLDIYWGRFQSVYLNEWNLLDLIQYWSPKILRIHGWHQKLLKFDKKGFPILFASSKYQLGHKSWRLFARTSSEGYLGKICYHHVKFFELLKNLSI